MKHSTRLHIINRNIPQNKENTIMIQHQQLHADAISPGDFQYTPVDETGMMVNRNSLEVI